LWAKTSNFELDARVPLIIATPSRPGGQRTESLVELLDIYPTLADLCGLNAPAELEGNSLRPVLDDPAAKVKEAAITQHPRPAYYIKRDDPLQAMGHSMRTDRYRYTEWRDVTEGRVVARELYDHEDDPAETVNLAGQSLHAQTMETLAAQLAETIRLPVIVKVGD
jgi:iduronate 2-sulfatase